MFPELFDPELNIADHRVLPQQTAFQDSENPYVWIHPADLVPERDSALRAKLERDCQVRYPPFHEDRTRGIFINTIKDIIRQNPTLSDEIPPEMQPPPLDSSPYSAPLSHLVHGEPFAEVLSAAEADQFKQATAIYLMIEAVLNERGYPELIEQTMNSLGNRGINSPNGERLFHELRDALGVGTTQLLRTIESQGAAGVANLLDVDPALQRDTMELIETIAPRGFPLNDVINWKVGRIQDGMADASVPAKMQVGLHTRINAMITSLREEVASYRTIPEQEHNERLVVAAFDKVPPVISELFFEEGGIIVFTQEPDLSNLVGMPATGYHVSFHEPGASDLSLNHIYISQDLGLPKTTRTIVHELNHLFCPAEHITPEEAAYGDALLRSDEQRLHILKQLADTYQTGNEATRSAVIDQLNQPEFQVAGMNFFDATDNVSMQTFVGAVNEAYHFLQMESPTYSRISTYNHPLDRFKEVWPRYAEMRYVEHIDHKDMMQFIVPGITEMYQAIYIPHLEERLETLKATRPSKVDTLMQHQTEAPLHQQFTREVARRETPPQQQQQELAAQGIYLTYPAAAAAQSDQSAPLPPHQQFEAEIARRSDRAVAMLEGDASAQTNQTPQPEAHISGNDAHHEGLTSGLLTASRTV